jgi:hypothetical protein
MIDYFVLADGSLLNHFLVYRSVILEVKAQQKSPYVMNACYLEKELVKEFILNP